MDFILKQNLIIRQTHFNWVKYLRVWHPAGLPNLPLKLFFGHYNCWIISSHVADVTVSVSIVQFAILFKNITIKKNRLQLCALRPELWLSGEAWWIQVCTSPSLSSHPLSSVHEPERPGYLLPLPDPETCGTSQYLTKTGWTQGDLPVYTLTIQYYHTCSQQYF